MRGRMYEFEGQMRTISQIRRMIPALGESAIQMRVDRGMTTRSAMLSFDSRAAMRTGGRKSRSSFGDTFSFGEKTKPL